MSEHVLETLGPSGHVSMTWNPDDPDDLARAKAEFARLKAAGFVFFEADAAPDAMPPGDQRAGPMLARGAGRLDVRRVEVPSPTARRTVATRPLQGGGA